MKTQKKMNGTVRDGFVLLLLVIGFLLVLAFFLFVMPVIQLQKNLLLGEVTEWDRGDNGDNGTAFRFQEQGEVYLKIRKGGAL